MSGLTDENFFSKLKHFQPQEIELIKEVYAFAQSMHKNQKRESGRDFFEHPVAVATILINMNFDAESVCAALLHDTVEDTDIHITTIKKKFGENIANLVDGLTKLTKISFKTNLQKNAENFRKLLMAISNDIRVLIIKLADRLHNMRTINDIKDEERRKRISEETLVIFAPLAERIGMYKVKNELEKLAFEQTNPIESKTIFENILEAKKTKQDIINDIIAQLRYKIKDEGGIGCIIYGREKEPYSVWKKMRRKNVSFEYLFDIIAFRIIVKDVPDCYKTLGVINSEYKMIPNTFKDYISTPKENGYQSLHIVVFGPRNIKIEIQIRTEEMHRVAEFGIASHWLYKHGSKDVKHVQDYKWIRELVTTFEHSKNIASTFKATKLQIHEDEVFCFTPKGDIFNLPKGSTIIDFAYAIHSDIGNRCIGGKINGNLVQIKTELVNGDEVEIITSKNSHPSLSWLNLAKTSKARSEVKHYVRIQKRKDFETLGRKIIEKYFEEQDLKISDKILEKNLSNFQQSNVNDIYAFIGEGLLGRQEVLRRLYPDVAKKIKKDEVTEKIKRKIQKQTDLKKAEAKKREVSEIAIEGLSKGMAIKFAKCCFPIPGDEIVGIINTGIGITVHKKNCKNIKNVTNFKEKSLSLKWSHNEGNENEKYISKLIAVLSNKTGSLAQIVNLFAEKGINIIGMSTINKTAEIREVEIEIEIQSNESLSDVLASVRSLKNVHSIKRF